MATDRDIRTLQQEVLRGEITRREFIVRALAMGASLTGIGTFLAACAPQPSPPAAAPTSAAKPAAPGPTTAPQAAAAPTGTQKLIMTNAQDVASLDPLRANDNYSTYVFNLIHDTVAYQDKDFNVKPNLAESWSTSQDGLTYTYKFRKGVKFHDGSELKADDVLFTIQRILDNKYPEGRKKERIDTIDSFKKIDDNTVEIKLKFAYAAFPASFGAIHIVPKAVVESVGNDPFAKKPVGCGPFKFVDWVPNDHVGLEAFNDYWRVKPKLTNITIRPIPENSVAVANLISGDVDVINDVVGANLRQIQGAAGRGVQLITKPSPSYMYAGFRMIGPPFTDLRFRQAVYMSTDFDALIKAVFPAEIGVRAYSALPTQLWPRDDEFLKGIALKKDDTKAKALFKQLMDEGVMPKDYKVTIAPPPDDARIKIAEAMATNLKENGVNAELLKVEFTTYIEMLEKGDQNLIYMLVTFPGIPDPDPLFRGIMTKDGAHGRYINIAKTEKDYATWEAQVKKAQASQSQEERAQIYRDLQRVLLQQVFHIPLSFKNAIMAKRDYVKDLDVNPNPVWDIVTPTANVYLEKK